jgi:hypothetical protein
MENRNLVLRPVRPQSIEPAQLPLGLRYSRGALYLPAALPASEWRPALVQVLEWARTWRASHIAS